MLNIFYGGNYAYRRLNNIIYYINNNLKNE